MQELNCIKIKSIVCVLKGNKHWWKLLFTTSTAVTLGCTNRTMIVACLASASSSLPCRLPHDSITLSCLSMVPLSDCLKSAQKSIIISCMSPASFWFTEVCCMNPSSFLPCLFPPFVYLKCAA
jgi:hypothetical protein